MTSTRRERHRQAIFDEIKATARRLMQKHGTAGLSLRAIAREMDMTSAALYYYYPSVGHLITALIVEAFAALTESLTQAVQAAGSSFASRALALSLAYREWALAHPTDF